VTDRLSPLGFGCASVMGRVGRAAGLRAMALAHDLGVMHFDVARSYGFGRAEAVLGEFARGRRDRITIATKFGILAPQLGLKARLAMPAMRWLSQRAPSLRAALRRESGRLLAAQHFDAVQARDSLETSLRELGTDHVDVYLLHDPPPLPPATIGEIEAEMQRLVQQGKVRRWGITFPDPRLHSPFEQAGHHVVQAEGHVDNAAAWASLRAGTRQRIVTRPFGGGSAAFARFGHEPQVVATIRQQLADVSATEVSAMAALSLAGALAGDDGCVICAMFSDVHVRANVAAAQRLASLTPPHRQALGQALLDLQARLLPSTSGENPTP